jgi:simple sugar transport system ATP-binding protein
VEILKLLYRESSVLILDEPTTVLTPTEIEQLFQAMRKVAGQGKAIVFISHKLNEVMEVADHVAILRQGRVVDSLEIGEVSSKRELAQRMVGRDVFFSLGREQLPPGEAVLHVRDLCLQRLEHVSLSLHAGEILAIVGVAGNGQKPLVEAVCGLTPPESGEIEICGRSRADFFSSPAARGELCYIPEDRLGLATCPNLDLQDNFLLTTRDRFSKGPWLDKAEARDTASRLFSDFNVQPSRVETRAGQLSGGNLQKLVLARELFKQPRLIVAEQPSQGLDISATEEIWANLLRSREKAGVLLITGDLNEALTLADRIAVIFRGRILDCFPRSDESKIESIGPLMAGIQDHEAHSQD